MHGKALLLKPYSSSCDVVTSAILASASLLSINLACRIPANHGARPHPSNTYRSIASRSNVITSSVLKNIKDHSRNHPVSIFHSRSDNPYHNLAIENYILKNSDPESKILLFYTNRPCVVFGRNQNPWLECNIARVQAGLPEAKYPPDGDGADSNVREIQNTTRHSLDLVRRRSGGGTVIHDSGNLNFSFIVPNDKDFTRDKHGELVVQSLQAHKMKDKFAELSLFDSVRINERHDIVMVRKGDATKKEFKVSGSAFKLTRGRALHHGTILHSSPNVHRQIPVANDEGGMVSTSIFSALLSSPAKPYLEAKGVASVRSPVHNLFDVQEQRQRDGLNKSLQEEIGLLFCQAYGVKDIPVEEVGDEDCKEEVNRSIHQDVQEIMTDDWRYCQTPTFDYRSNGDAGEVDMHFQVNHGIVKSPILSAKVNLSEKDRSKFIQLGGMKLHEIQSWKEYLPTLPDVGFNETIVHIDMVFPQINLERESVKPGTAHGITEGKASTLHDEAGFVTRETKSGDVEVEKKGNNIIIER